jgi:hypothetical protein
LRFLAKEIACEKAEFCKKVCLFQEKTPDVEAIPGPVKV